MKIKTMYGCPTCHRIWDMPQQALRCRNAHEIEEKTAYICEVCGERWDAQSVVGGAVVAAEEARECERNHRRTGDVDNERKLSSSSERASSKSKFYVISMEVPKKEDKNEL